ncbi:hypothetical protein [Hymenobacter latericus]|uniref:hypothetical protein n=1 Tax=Hymenobacter sp. YIM 151858-1 TaxID=2987688 RepID=UPI002227F68E|nr:hypothetical protein [Hymenobacter sp. YIM 151858-1]UYZ57864.1 hypothetical protein OIS50_12430 [Hymenobacter sp. YIM 151858-1]
MQPVSTSVTTFHRPDGYVYLTAERNRHEGWICARWSGIQTLSTVMEGGMAYLDMLREEPCAKLLNDHSELVGPFSEANEWIANVWTPLTIEAGLRYFAQVLSPGIFGQLSVQDLHRRIGNQFEMRLFDNPENAKNWLRSVG